MNERKVVGLASDLIQIDMTHPRAPAWLAGVDRAAENEATILSDIRI